MIESIVIEASPDADAALFGAVADGTRLRILRQLARSGATCVCNIDANEGLAANLLSYHLRVLREAGLVTTARRGRWIDYSLAPDALDRLHFAIPAEAPGTAAVAAAWVALYVLNERIWDWGFGALGIDTETRAGGAAHFFLYDSAKILLLLVGMIFAIGLLRTTLSPERVRSFIEGKPLLLALVLAALLGAITPFCTCSSVPIFIGFVAAGIPLSVALTFLIASPLINEVAVVMLGSTFGWGPTAAYVGTGLGLAIGVGLVLSRFDLKPLVREFVFSAAAAGAFVPGRRPTLGERVTSARRETRDIVGKVWIWVLVGVAVGAAIHGWVPESFFVEHASADNPLAVPLATLVGVPLYSNAASAIPIGEALYAKGVPLGTVFAFMMSTAALSFPEAILLNRILKMRLLLTFFAIVAGGIMLIGFAFNAFA